jgi:hypothetical protein
MPNARITDPVTSHEAAATVRNLTATMEGIVTVLKHRGPQPDDMIARYYSLSGFPYASPSGLRSRRAELVDLGIIEPSGEFAKTPSGRRTIVWRLVAN